MECCTEWFNTVIPPRYMCEPNQKILVKCQSLIQLPPYPELKKLTNTLSFQLTTTPGMAEQVLPIMQPDPSPCWKPLVFLKKYTRIPSGPLSWVCGEAKSRV